MIEETGSRVLLTVAAAAIGVQGHGETGSRMLLTVVAAAVIINVGATDLLVLVISVVAVGMEGGTGGPDPGSDADGGWTWPPVGPPSANNFKTPLLTKS